MKKILTMLIAIIMIVSCVSVFAEQIVTVTLNGNPIEFDVPAQVINDRTLIPVRVIAESFGITVDWISETQTVVLANYKSLLND